MALTDSEIQSLSDELTNDPDALELPVEEAPAEIRRQWGVESDGEGDRNESPTPDGRD